MARNKVPSQIEALLLGCAVSERTGLELADEFEARTGERINEGTLYSTLRRLSGGGWLRVREGQDIDGRLRWYRISAKGWTALQEAYAHHDRMRELLGPAIREGRAT